MEFAVEAQKLLGVSLEGSGRLRPRSRKTDARRAVILFKVVQY